MHTVVFLISLTYRDDQKYLMPELQKHDVLGVSYFLLQVGRSDVVLVFLFFFVSCIEYLKADA